jgi:hypothetical protein
MEEQSMDPETITVLFHDSKLMAVPSIHFNHIFASEVNRICSKPETRPEAIAIELGPRTAEVAISWLKELGIGPGNHKKLPVMLGLTKQNRMIRSSFREKAFRLQEEIGKDLSELPPEVLHRELEFAGCGLLCLSPTDSIIEAMRCALELNIPLYGVDLEKTAYGHYGPILVPDPIPANGNLIDYVARNAPYAAQQRDEEIDSRREIAMAARLKALKSEYRRILFTCGLAHWLPIRKLLEDPSLRPSPFLDPPDQKEGDFTRVIVHPLIAIYHMDLFPALVKEYETSRRPSNESTDSEDRKTALDPIEIFEDLLKKTYLNYFCRKTEKRRYKQRYQDLAIHRQFEAYLNNLCVLNHRVVPDLVMTIKAAQQTMSKDFVRTLSARFLHFPWASPDQFPDCSLLVPSSGHEDRGLCAAFSKNGLQHGQHFYIQPMHGNSQYSTDLEIPYKWRRVRQKEEDGGLLHTWIPWDFLISSMSLRAINHSRGKKYERKTEVFEGSILEGIDIKSTLRACSRGEDVVYVRDRLKKYSCDTSHPGDGFPVVWILDPREHRGARWNALYEDCDWMRKHVRDPESLDWMREKRGHKMIALIGYGDLHLKTKASDRNRMIQTDRYYGILIYQPICWTKNQFAHWVEVTGYKRNPFCDRNELGLSALSDLTAYFEKEHGVKIGEFDWATTLMLFAIPFAKDRVTVVVPSNYQIPPLVFERARRYGIEISIAPLTPFSQQEIERVSLNYMAPALTMEPRCIFSKSIEEAIGESQTANRDLVPQSWIDFGNELI